MEESKKNSRFGITLLKGLIRGYQWFIAPTFLFLFGGQASCRFPESCSRYFLRQVEERGFYRGGWLGVKRISRCHPWGGKDP